ncbi:hypothetical protein E2553_35100 [Paraburkholderia dipogonis]|uniref:Uncharacterized protein n=1 Tax=Paraburkholderia dipogonis TaxID=1211383 RepID=A0A4Y8MWE1_9BURK|nr:hypothetical protein [Paraburkholderia dipogonis]TFE41870.1 hypothetical protein E2553_35100 [Paraburkholderia dipogonis]
MQDIEFHTLDGDALLLTVNAEFVESVRQHTLGEGTPTSYVATVSDVLGQMVETDERCLVLVLPGLASEAIDLSVAHINEQVRVTPKGSPVACALFANNQVAVNAHALNEAQPMISGRLTVLWVFKDRITMRHYPYDDDTERRLWLVSSVADGHRHETDYRAEANIDVDADAGVIEVLSCFTFIETAG